jgi:hypothetical protein
MADTVIYNAPHTYDGPDVPPLEYGIDESTGEPKLYYSGEAITLLDGDRERLAPYLSFSDNTEDKKDKYDWVTSRPSTDAGTTSGDGSSQESDPADRQADDSSSTSSDAGTVSSGDSSTSTPSSGTRKPPAN